MVIQPVSMVIQPVMVMQPMSMVIHPVIVMQPVSMVLVLSGLGCVFGYVAVAFAICVYGA